MIWPVLPAGRVGTEYNNSGDRIGPDDGVTKECPPTGVGVGEAGRVGTERLNT